MNRASTRPLVRSGAAAVWALVVLTLVSGFTVVAATRAAQTRKKVDREQALAQAVWLARSGVELAIDRLLTNLDGYTGETVSPVRGGEIQIVVRKHLKKADVYEIESKGRFRSGVDNVLQSSRSTVKLQRVAGGSRAEVVPDEP